LPEVSLVDFSLRRAVEADFPAIRQLIRESRLNPTGLNWRRFIVAQTSQGDFAGCGQIKPHSEGTLELASIAIKEDYRDKGLASQVIRRLLADEPDRPIYLTCRSELGDFYQKFGFRTLDLGEMPPYYRRLSRLVNLFLRLSKKRLLVMSLETVEKEI
jgi:N-acetylglutamate synthase-like GNAT family acetyltransferase